MYELLLITHGGLGAVALFGAAIAIATRLFGWAHKWHIISGNAFTTGMLGVAITGFAITLINPSLFLLALAVFLLYLTLMGWRYAKARKGIGGAIDKTLALAFMAAFIAMIGYGVYILTSLKVPTGWVMVVFGVIGLLNAQFDLRTVFGQPVTGQRRIIAHLSRMLGGTIGAITAFLLVQMQTNSVWVWLAPTFILTPLIFIWSAKLRGGWFPKKAPIVDVTVLD